MSGKKKRGSWKQMDAGLDAALQRRGAPKRTFAQGVAVAAAARAGRARKRKL
jgi:hypothetical protein